MDMAKLARNARIREPHGIAWQRSCNASGHASVAVQHRQRSIMPAKIHLFPCLHDNFGVLLHDPATGATAAIDAPEAAAGRSGAEGNGWKLTDILVTHHHGDHTDGIAELKKQYSCRVVAPRTKLRKIPACRRDRRRRRHGESRLADGARARDARAYRRATSPIVFDADKLAFVGDTLFSIGCGRVIEGTPEMMWKSLLKLRDLPDDTQILLRSRIYAGQYPLRAARSSRTTAALQRAPRKSTAARRREADPSATIGAEKRRQFVPARGRAGRRRRRRMAGQAGGGGVCARSGRARTKF